MDLWRIEWARKEGKWWFIPPVTDLKLDLKDKSVITSADKALLEMLAQDAEFKLTIY